MEEDGETVRKNRIECSKKAEWPNRTLGRMEEDSILLTDNPDYDSFPFYKPLSDDNFRMINQQGIFTISRSPHSIEEWVSLIIPKPAFSSGSSRPRNDSSEKREADSGNQEWVDSPKSEHRDLAKDRAQILRTLNRMNINYARVSLMLKAHHCMPICKVIFTTIEDALFEETKWMTWLRYSFYSGISSWHLEPDHRPDNHGEEEESRGSRPDARGNTGIH